MATRRSNNRDPGERDAVTPDRVLDAAMAILTQEGLRALSMRRLAAELGVGSPTVYWHIGNRDALLDQLIARITDDLGKVEPKGNTPAERISSICRGVVREVRGRPQLIALSATRGRGEAIFIKAQEVLARELAAAGLRGEEAAFALSTILFHLGGFILLENAVSHDYRVHGVARWDEGDDPDLNARLREGVDPDKIFQFGLDAVIDALLGRAGTRRTASRRRR